MEHKTLLDKQGEDEIKKIFNWIKRSKKNADSPKSTHNGHCNNYSSHCCLSCDKCWGAKTQK